MKKGFDNAKYLQMQSQHIRERIAQFDNKLYLEFGGKLFDDYHASRVLPGFEPDSKLQMLLQLKEQAEIVIVISAQDIISSKVRGDYGITYDLDVLRLIDAFQGMGLFVGSVCVTMYTAAPEVEAFEHKLNSVGVRTFRHYKIPGYPNDVARIVSDEGYGKNDYIETQRPLVVITAPGPGSGKMATCLSQLYHEHKRGVKAGYAKFETFPIWNLPLKHPVNLAYEAATADLNDVNMIDPFHLEAYGVTTVNYNRDIEIFPVVNAMFELIAGKSPYKSPTDMGVNMAGNCIVDDEACREASRNEIIRRYFKALCDHKTGKNVDSEIFKLELLLNQAGLAVGDRAVEKQAHAVAERTGGAPAAAIELPDGTVVTGKNGPLLGAASSALLNALKKLAGIDHEIDLVSARAIEPIQTLKTNYLGSRNPRLHTDEILIALSSSAAENETAAVALQQLSKLKGCDMHSTVILSSVDTDPAYTEEQIGYFRDTITNVRLHKIPVKLFHMAASPAIELRPDSYCDMVRAGHASFGLSDGFEPVLSFKSRIVFAKEVAAGASISYNRSFIASSTMKVATIPVGYGDGYLRALSNKADVLIKGVRCRVLGNITMDMCMVDISAVPDARVGDEVVLIGRQGAEEIRAKELAQKAGTIDYELTTLLMPRVPRFYQE